MRFRMSRISTGDVAASVTAGSAMSFPVWWEHLPIILAPVVAILGLGIAIFTLVAKYYEIRANRALALQREDEAEHAESAA